MLLKTLKAFVFFVFSTLAYVVFMALKFLMRTLLGILALPFALLFIMVTVGAPAMLDLLKIMCGFLLLSFILAGLQFLGTAAKNLVFSGYLPHLLALMAIFYAIVTLKYSTRSLRTEEPESAHNTGPDTNIRRSP